MPRDDAEARGMLPPVTSCAYIGRGGCGMARAQIYAPEAPMSREEFLAWVKQQPSGRYERIDGIVVAMAPERASPNLRKGAARDALRQAVAEAGLNFLPDLPRWHDRAGRGQRL